MCFVRFIHVASSTTAQVQQELKEIESFINMARKKLGDQEDTLVKQFLDKKERLLGFISTFKDLTSLHKVSKC